MSTVLSERQQTILEATIQLLAEQGLAGVTHRAVDAAAGLPQGSTSYYYSKKMVLLEAAAHHLVDLFDEGGDEVRQTFADLISAGKTDEAITFVAEDLLKCVDEHQMLLLAYVELTLAGTRFNELKPLSNRLAEANRKPIAFFLKLLTATISNEEVNMCTGILDGIALSHITQQSPKPTIEQLKHIFLSVVPTQDD
ncbi:MAG: TetR family transcriptional regulator [Deinococcota bacterium]